jgi:rhodanese-related sulfurtransferase
MHAAETASSLGHQAKVLVSQGAVLLDVRTPEECAAGKLPKSHNIPLHELPNRLRELPDKQCPIVVYCRSGGRSAQAAQLLQRAGYRQVFDLGAMTNW